jgi:hypothetical protein
VEPLAGKPVLDATNYIPQRDGRIPGLHDGSFVAPYGGLSDERGTPAGIATIRAALGL